MGLYRGGFVIQALWGGSILMDMENVFVLAASPLNAIIYQASGMNLRMKRYSKNISRVRPVFPTSTL